MQRLGLVSRHDNYALVVRGGLQAHPHGSSYHGKLKEQELVSRHIMTGHSSAVTAYWSNKCKALEAKKSTIMHRSCDEIMHRSCDEVVTQTVCTEEELICCSM